jgi:hypothetical protein
MGADNKRKSDRGNITLDKPLDSARNKTKLVIYLFHQIHVLAEGSLKYPLGNHPVADK